MGFDRWPVAYPRAADADVVAALSAIVGAQACTTQGPGFDAHVLDYRKLYTGRAIAVVKPASTDEVSRVMRWCHEHDVAVVPQGGNTSLAGGAVPEPTHDVVVLNLVRMRRVLAIDVDNDTIAVQAGLTLAEVRAAAADAGRLFPLRIGSEGSCQIGGNLSTNAGGTAVLRYGNMRDLVLGLEAVLPDGTVYTSMKGLRKDNTGYDLKQLFIGSEGTLGIITGAVLKLVPLPQATAVAFVAVRSPAAAVVLLGMAKKMAGPAVTAFELVSGPAMDLVLAYLKTAPAPLAHRHAWQVLVELSGSGDEAALNALLLQILEAGLEAEFVLDAAVASSGAQAQAFWKIREEISDAQTREGGSVRCDVSVPISRLAGFVDAASARVLALEPAARMVVYGHMGDGNVHFNPLRPAGVDTRDFMQRSGAAIADAVDALAHAVDGSISAEHGIGVAKRDALREVKSDAELALMWRIKRALDPKLLLNPRKVLPELG